MNSSFDSLLLYSHLPLKRKIAKIILIKRVYKTDRDSYKTISSFTSLSKIFKTIIHSRSLDCLHDPDSILKISIWLQVESLYCSATVNRVHTFLVWKPLPYCSYLLLIYQRRLIMSGHLYQQRVINTPTYPFNINNSFLWNRQLFVEINYNISDPKPIHGGVSQLARILINIYVTGRFSGTPNEYRSLCKRHNNL